MRRNMIKTNKLTVRPAKTQISLGICIVWSESSLCAWRNIGSLATHWAPSRKHAYIILTPLNPHFYIVKLGFAGVYIIFLISA